MLFFKMIVYIQILILFGLVIKSRNVVHDLIYLYITNCWASSPTSVQRKAVGNIPMKN